MRSKTWIWAIVHAIAAPLAGGPALAQSCNNNGTCNSNEDHVSCPNDCFRVGGLVFDNPNDPLFSGLADVVVVAEGIDGTPGVFQATTSDGGGQPAVAGIYAFELSPGRYRLSYAQAGWCFFAVQTQGGNIQTGDPTPLTVDVNSGAGELGNIFALGVPGDSCGTTGECTSNGQCNDGDACTVDTCVGGVCENIQAACCQDSDCDDGNPCTIDNCTGGTCSFGDAGCCLQDIECDDGNACTADSCDGGQCQNTPMPCCDSDGDCDDGNACTTDTCVNEMCQSVAVPECCGSDAECNDNNPCTTDTCGAGTCTHDPLDDGTPCDDGSICTLNDACAAGVCTGATNGACSPGGSGGSPGGGGGVSPTLGDLDEDGTPTSEDNCPRTPNGPELGTCVVTGDPCIVAEDFAAPDRCSNAQDDGDGDGIGDVCDLDRDDDGELNATDDCPDDANKRRGGTCGCGTPDLDGDDDGIADCNDGCPADAAKDAPGVCGCGVTDGDTDDDGVPDCADECPNDAAKTAVGECGCGTLDVDGDADGLLDCLDNCPDVPNGLSLGTCVTGEVGRACAADAECDCIVDDERGIAGTALGVCSRNQEDGDGDGLGDACQFETLEPCPEPSFQDEPPSGRPCGLSCGNTGSMSLMAMMLGLMAMRQGPNRRRRR